MNGTLSGCLKRTFLLSGFLLVLTTGWAQSPTAPAQGFNVFLEKGGRFASNETEGPVAMGKDLTISGNYQVSTNYTGSFTVSGVKVTLVVGGKVSYQSGNSLQVNQNGYVKIGDSTGSKVWYKDQNNAFSPIRITPGSNYNATPRLSLQANAQQLGVSASNNPVFQGGLIDFSSAFNRLKMNSTSMAACADNAQLTNPNGTVIGRSNLPNQVKINLATGFNILNLKGSDMNTVNVLTFNSKPSASKVLIINVDAPGTFNWNVWNSAGIGFSDCPYILYNFYNTTTLNIQGNSTIEGTVFAPYADITKTSNQSNIEGQIIAQSYYQSAGENHYAVFSPSYAGCIVQPTANFSVNNSAQCLSGNSFVFTSTSTGTGPFTYQWNFGDASTSSLANPVKSYTAAGTYTVTLTVSGPGGNSSKSSTVTVNNCYQPTVAGFSISNNTQCLQGNSFSFSNATTGSGPFTYAWYFGDGSGSSAVDPVKTYASAGTYTVKLVASGAGGVDSISYPVYVNAHPANGFSINNNSQQLSGNNFVFSSISPSNGDSIWWDFGDGSTLANGITVSKSYTSTGVYTLTQTISSSASCSSSFTGQVTVTGDSVGTGNEGGLESASLGGLVSKRDYQRIKNSVNYHIDYGKAAVFSPWLPAQQTASIENQQLQELVPLQLEPGDVPMLSTPIDLLDLTSAIDVLAVDYVNNNKAKAVVLGIKTAGEAYTHTKAICDRLRGAAVLSLEPVTIGGFNFIQFALRQQDGVVEHAISFTASRKAGRDTYHLQSGWLVSEFAGDDTLYTFQVWASKPALVRQLVAEILNKLSVAKTVEQVGNAQLPNVYISRVYRDRDNLLVYIQNNSALTDVKLQLEEKLTENSIYTQLEIPLTLKPNSNAYYHIPVKDGYEYEGFLMAQTTPLDKIYIADGNWGLDYVSSNTSISEYLLENDPARSYSNNELPLYRNVTLKGSTSDYITLYRAVKPGTMRADLQQYQFLHFKAKGKGNLVLRLTKESILQWQDQYKTTVQLDEAGRDYYIPLSAFKSDKYAAAFVTDDIKIMMFSFEASGTTQNFDFSLSEVGFLKQYSPSTGNVSPKLSAPQFSIYPNPGKAGNNFVATFASLYNEELNISVTNLLGQVVYIRKVKVVNGLNSIPLYLDQKPGVYMITMRGEATEYQVVKLVVQ